MKFTMEEKGLTLIPKLRSQETKTQTKKCGFKIMNLRGPAQEIHIGSG